MDPQESSKLETSLHALLEFCRNENWAGWDPYDGLTSPLFEKVPLLRNPICRLVFIQLLKRSPFNARPLFGIPKARNPKGIALFASALTKLAARRPPLEQEAHALLKALIECRSPDTPHSCWGYNFDWQTRTFLVPRFTPNIICSTFGGNALLDGFETFGNEEYLEHALSTGRFLLTGLNRTVDGDTFCFSYTPLDSGEIHNASLLGAAFLARLHRHAPDNAFRENALAATTYSTNRMRPDGSWPYGETPAQRWIDSFHTGYNLRALEQVRRQLDFDLIEPMIRRGYDFFLKHFFTPHHTVKYFHDCELPIDMHAVATAIITLVELADYNPRSLDQAWNVWKWADREMRSPSGWFYYQKRRSHVVKIPYMRWVQAWMLLAMVVLLDAAREQPLAEGENISVLSEKQMGTDS